MARERSNTGCWTCRMRRKKCDEKSPECDVCILLHIPCYGYLARPAWMDGGTLEKLELERVKSMVKETNKRKRRRVRARAAGSRPALDASGQAGSPRNSIPDHLAANSDHNLDRSDTRLDGIKRCASSAVIQEQTDSVAQPRIYQEGHAQNTCFHCGLSKITDASNDEESRLLMHYLDIVFPLLFRFYNPLVSEGGRGWLLTILLRTKPLFHAALSLSAYHQKKLLAVDTNENISNTLPDLEGHHILTLVELRHHIDSLKTSRGTMTRKTQVEVLACMIHLISFEVSLETMSIYPEVF